MNNSSLTANLLLSISPTEAVKSTSKDLFKLRIIDNLDKGGTISQLSVLKYWLNGPVTELWSTA